MSDAAPKYVYKLVLSAAPVPTPLPERLPVSDLDQKSGFVHLSTARQIPNTLKLFFKDDPLVYVLRIEYEKVEKDIRWESPDGSVGGPKGGEGMFPHLYNGQKIGKDEVEDVAVLTNENGWDKALQSLESWLTY